MKRFVNSLPQLGAIVCLTIVASMDVSATDTNSAEQKEILLGMSTVLSGPAANLGREMLQGVQAGLDRANRDAAASGRRLRLVALDDGYEPARTAPNMRQLLERDNVLAIVGNVGTPTSVAAIPIALEDKTLFFSPFTGAGVLRKNPPDRYVINYRASYAEEIGTMIDALLSSGHVKVEDIAVFTQRDAYGDAGYAGCVAALKRHGLKSDDNVPHVRYERNTLAVEDALATLLLASHTPRAIVMVGAYAPCAKFIKLAHQAGLDAIFYNVSFVGTESLAAELGSLPVHVFVTQVVPQPAGNEAPIVRDYQSDLKASDANAKPGYGSLEGYVAMRIFELGLAKVSGPLTRERMVDALEGLGQFDIGLGEPLHLDPGHHQACHRVWLTSLQNGRFVPCPWNSVTTFVSRDISQ